MTYISVHIDGALDCQDVRVGLLKFSPEEIPVAQISLLAGLQKHPAWALQRLAVVVYAYSQVATRHGYAQIQVSAHGTLVSTETSSNGVVALGYLAYFDDGTSRGRAHDSQTCGSCRLASQGHTGFATGRLACFRSDDFQPFRAVAWRSATRLTPLPLAYPPSCKGVGGWPGARPYGLGEVAGRIRPLRLLEARYNLIV